jgi:hypothetical protein
MVGRALVPVAWAAAVALVATLAAPIAPVAGEPRLGDESVQVGRCAAQAGDALATAGGSRAGYVSCGPGPHADIRFLASTPGGDVRPSEPTWMAGDVLGMASDATGTYVLYATSVDIRVGKRTTTGGLSFRVVDGWRGRRPEGDIIARDGRWFAVWSKQAGPGGRLAQTELFSAGSIVPVRQVTDTPADVADAQPSLVYNGPTPVLVWSRTHQAWRPGPSDLMVSKYLGGSWQATRVFTAVGQHNTEPDVRVARDRTFVTWVRDGFVMVASDATGAFVSHRFATRGARPRVAASTNVGGAIDRVLVAWTTTDAPGDQRAYAAVSASAGGAVDGAWEGAVVSSRDSTLLGAAPAAPGVDAAGAGTVVVAGPERVVSRTVG